MKILQLNIFFKENIDNILKTIRELNPDVLCLQELSFDSDFNKSIHTAYYLAHKLNMNLHYQYAHRWMNSVQKEQGNAILSSYPFIDMNAVYLQNSTFDARGYGNEGRVYVEASVNIHGQIYTIATTHLSYNHKFSMTPAKKIEVDKLIHILKQKKERYIFTGDLNTPPDSYPIEQISNYFKNAGPDFNQKTWTTKLFEKDGFTEKNLNWRLDYVFCTPDVTIQSAQIIKTNFSDHLPILVEFN
jgi:endonuclease/exonuclease/phosphatase family metal-dependent hydrolase